MEILQGQPFLLKIFLSVVVDFYDNTCRYSEALKYFLEFEKYLDDSEEQLKANILNRIATIYNKIPQFDTAIEYLQKSLRIALRIKDRDREMCCYGNFGNIYRDHHQNEKAIHYFEKTLPICVELGDRKQEGFCYANLGLTYMQLGQNQRALDYLKKSLSINLELGERSNQLSDYSDIGCVFMNLAQYQKAIEYFEKCLSLSIQTGNQSIQGMSYGHLGVIYTSVGQYERAICYHRKAIAISKLMGDRINEGRDRGNLGIAYMFLGQYEKAIKHYKKGLAINIETKDRAGEGTKYSALGQLYSSLGQYETAIDYITKGLDIRVEIGALGDQATSYQHLGKAYQGLRRYDKAMSCFQKSLNISLETGDRFNEGLSKGNIGTCNHFMACLEVEKDKTLNLKAKYLLNNSVVYLTRALRNLYDLFIELVADGNKVSFINEHFNLHEYLMSSFILLKRPEAALLAIDLGRAKALQFLVDQRLDSRDQNTRHSSYGNETWASIEEQKEKERLNDVVDIFEQKQIECAVLMYCLRRAGPVGLLYIWVVNRGREGIKFTSLEQMPIQVDLFNKDVESILSSVSTKLPRNFYYFHPKTCPKIIPAGIVSNDFVSFHVSSNFIMCADPDVDSQTIHALHLESLFSKKLQTSFGKNVSTSVGHESKIVELRTAVLQYDLAVAVTSTRAPVINPNTKNSAMSVADESTSKKLISLYNILIEPVKHLIKERRLIIVPDDILFFVPFCSLLDERRRPLSEKHSIQMTPSLHSLAASMKVPVTSKPGPALFVGNPTVGKVRFDGKSHEVPPLPCSKEEAISLARRFDAEALVDENATKGRVLQCMQDASVIHMAAHGEPDCGEVFLAPNPIRDRVGLPTEKSYLLRQQDVINLRLSACLVVLSCCHTGRGLVSPEGVVGLARSFLGAGARSVLVALWAIPDEVTKVFMEHFYDEICRTTSVCEALKMTMNAFQTSDDVNRRSFRTWAPFTIIGEDVKFTKEDIEEIKKRSRENTTKS